MQTREELCDEFQRNVALIATQLNEGFGVRHKRGGGPQSPLVRWFDFRLRVVDPRPRTIYLSDKFPKTLDQKTAGALAALVEAIRNGDDINPYQSKGLLRNDSSGKRRAERTDLLWADWGIHHLHVSDERIEGKYFSARSGQLLFVLFGPDFALFIDVLPHSGDKLRFSREELIRIVARNWPEVLAQFELKGVLAGTSPTDAERDALRRGGVDAPLFLDGKAFFAPGRGVTSASTPGKVTDMLIRLRQDLRALAEYVLDLNGQFMSHLSERGSSEIHFSLQLHPVGIVLDERSTGHAWTFPDARVEGPNSAFAEICDMFTPPWVREAMNRK